MDTSLFITVYESAIAMFPQFMTLWVNPNYYVSQSCYVIMLCPSHLHACYHLVTEVPWPWHLRHRCHDSFAMRVISRGVPHVCWPLWLLCFHGGVWVHPSFHVHVITVIVMCALHPSHWSWSLHPWYKIRGHPSIACEAAPHFTCSWPV